MLLHSISLSFFVWSQCTAYILFTVHFSTLFPRTLLPDLPTGLFILYFPMNILYAFVTPHQRILLSRVLLKMAMGPRLVKNLPAFYVTQSFITVYTTARHLSFSSVRWIRSTPSHHVPLRSILISPSHLLLCISSHLFPSGFPSKLLYAFLFFSMVAAYLSSRLMLLQCLSWGPL